MKNLRKLFYLIIVITIVAFSSCMPTKTSSSYNPLLLNCWTHSHEENQEGVKIYRPCDFKKFPPSRYRRTFTLNENGTAKYLVLSPTDAHFEEEGKWIYLSDSKSLIIKDLSGEEKMKFKIEELSKDKLLIKER